MAKRKIFLGALDKSTCPIYVEGLAVDAFTPGTVIERTASGLETSDVANTVFGSELIVAKEISEGEGGTIDTAVTVGDTAVGISLISGQFANVMVAGSQALVAGVTKLVKNGAGALEVATTDGTESIVAVAEETVTTTTAALVTVKKL